MIVYLVKKDFEDTAKQILKDILWEKYDARNDKILLDLPGGALNIAQQEIQKTDDQLTRDDVIKRIHSFAEKQITAEGNGALKVLMTDPVQNLIRKYKNSIPNTVIMGAKGSGKTFLYREILRNQFWEKF